MSQIAPKNVERPTKKKAKLTIKDVESLSPILHEAPARIPENELYKPKLVKISVKITDKGLKESANFEVPLGLLCAHSTYFEKALCGPWKESKQCAIKLPDTDPRVFRYFVRWLYTQQIYGQSTLSREQEPSDDDQAGEAPVDMAYDENDANNPVTWFFEDLFCLYVLPTSTTSESSGATSLR